MDCGDLSLAMRSVFGITGQAAALGSVTCTFSEDAGTSCVHALVDVALPDVAAADAAAVVYGALTQPNILRFFIFGGGVLCGSTLVVRATGSTDRAFACQGQPQAGVEAEGALCCA